MPDSTRRIVCHNFNEIAAFMGEFLEQWKDYRIVGDEFRPVGRDTVFVTGRQVATGKQSGIAVEGPIFAVWTFRDGHVVRLVFETHLEPALEAAGLTD
jgi:hypothetical protein